MMEKSEHPPGLVRRSGDAPPRSGLRTGTLGVPWQKEGRSMAVKEIHLIEENAVYSAPAVQQALGLAKGTLRREIRLGRLQVSRRAGRYYFMGSWLLEWLRGGLVRRRPVAQLAEQLTAA